ncbi:hypothetical protein CHUAL_004213 [Chamberlinius hualienensis]
MDKELQEYRAKKSEELKQPKTPIKEAVSSPRLKITPSRPYQDNVGLLYWVSLVLKIVLWFSLWMLFVKLQFGVVYIVVSGLYLLWKSLKVGLPRREGELSAYSVFNPNFEVLSGTLTAEQFDKEIRRELVGETSVVMKAQTNLTGEALKETILRTLQSLTPLADHFILAVNCEYVQNDSELSLKEGDEVAVIPPISGG